MRHFWIGVLAVLSGLSGGSAAQADYMSWSYQWTLSNGPTFTSGFTNVALALHPGASSGASSIPIGNFSTNSASPSTDSFHASYDLALTLTDNVTHDSGHLSFHGTLSGSVGTSTSNVTNVFTTPSEALTLDGHIYHVTLDTNTGVRGPDDGIASIRAQVSVTDVTKSGPGTSPNPPTTPSAPVHQTPEPTALLLAGLGLSLCGTVRWRRRRFPSM